MQLDRVGPSTFGSVGQMANRKLLLPSILWAVFREETRLQCG